MKRTGRNFWTVISLAAGAACLATSPAEADIIHLDDVIINSGTEASLCVGFDCVDGEVFGFDTIRLKENNLRIKFEDTSSTASFATEDWQLVANSEDNGGPSAFWIQADGPAGAGLPIFVVEAGAPENSLYVDDGGRLGLGTSTPVVDVHTKNGNTPTLRLEQDGSRGFDPQTWDVAGNETGFFVRDATNSSTLPFRIFPGAPSNSLVVASTGWVGINTSSPTAALTVEGDATLGSSREIKENLAPASGDELLSNLMRLPILTWNYRDDPRKSLHLGPMAEDFHAAFGFGADDKHISPADTSGLALVAIQRLNRKVEELTEEKAQLRTELEELRVLLNSFVETQAPADE